VGVEQELDRARARVADGARRGEGGGRHLGTETRGEHRARRLLDDLLVAALDRALALAEMDERAVAVAQHLHLDVAGTDEELLEVDAPVGEGGPGLAPGGGERVRQLGPARHRAHALAAAARGTIGTARSAARVCGAPRSASE